MLTSTTLNSSTKNYHMNLLDTSTFIDHTKNPPIKNCRWVGHSNTIFPAGSRNFERTNLQKSECRGGGGGFQGALTLQIDQRIGSLWTGTFNSNNPWIVKTVTVTVTQNKLSCLLTGSVISYHSLFPLSYTPVRGMWEFNYYSFYITCWTEQDRRIAHLLSKE